MSWSPRIFAQVLLDQVLVSFLFALLLAGQSLAIPSPTPSNENGGFTIPVTWVGYDKHMERKRQLERRGPKDAAEAAMIEKDRIYTVEVEVGEPKQDMRLIVDTGSADLYAHLNIP